METNGLADSSQLVQTFWLDEGVGSRVQLHQTIAVVDTLNFRKHADSQEVPKDEDEQNAHPENELLLRQLVHADKILLNKVDLLEQQCQKDQKPLAEEIQHVKQCIAHVNKHALLKETTYAKADLQFLITKDKEVGQLEKSMVKSSHALSHAIIDSIKSVYVALEDQGKALPLDKDKLEFFIGELLWEGPTTRNLQIMRCKGTFVDKSTGTAYILQGVEDLFEFREVKEEPRCSFLFVGKGDINGEAIKKEIIERCCT